MACIMEAFSERLKQRIMPHRIPRRLPSSSGQSTTANANPGFNHPIAACHLIEIKKWLAIESFQRYETFTGESRAAITTEPFSSETG
jgi:hypothetical protein